MDFIRPTVWELTFFDVRKVWRQLMTIPKYVIWLDQENGRRSDILLECKRGGLTRTNVHLQVTFDEVYVSGSKMSLEKGAKDYEIGQGESSHRCKRHLGDSDWQFRNIFGIKEKKDGTHTRALRDPNDDGMNLGKEEIRVNSERTKYC